MVFSSDSIRGDTIYLSFDIDERDEIEAYNVAARKMIRSSNLDGQRMAQPHTLVDSLSFCSTVVYEKLILISRTTLAFFFLSSWWPRATTLSSFLHASVLQLRPPIFCHFLYAPALKKNSMAYQPKA
jgi:hypothetical protein